MHTTKAKFKGGEANGFMLPLTEILKDIIFNKPKYLYQIKCNKRLLKYLLSSIYFFPFVFSDWYFIINEI